jgi:molybdenum cofactor cytidylyltransferase
MSPAKRPGGSVAAVILAAGRSRRFGSAKQLARLEGRTLLEHVIERALAAGLRPVVTVVPPWLSRPAAIPAAVRWIRNPHPNRGMSYSLRLGLEALDRETPAALVLLGDQPTVEPASIAAVLAARGERPIVAATADGHAAPPVLVEREAFDRITDLRGDVGLRGLIAAEPDLVTPVAVDRHPVDVDRPTDLAQLGFRMPGTERMIGPDEQADG